MKTFQFVQKNSNIMVILSANSLEEAEEILFDTVKFNYGWRVSNPDGEDEEEF
jgi:hypothetical protein